jgi:hypothetical protein
MKLVRTLLFALPLAVLAATQAPQDAAACGACFAPVGEPTQVTGHRMLLSISTQQTTLWDQISYTGDPQSFAWVLPIKGQVDIGLSSDVLFAALSDETRVNILPPPLDCPPPPSCWGDQNEPGPPNAGGGFEDGGSGVTVVAQQVVGPYETVQLSSQDPSALSTWLTSHGYNIPADIAPVISAYVKEGFNFLALKLVPGQGIDSMRPVRVTSPGASPTLPLRMVAGGTGATTSLTLWIVGEGRYATTNFPSFVVNPADLVWDWDTSSSNYADLKQAGFDKSNGTGWLVEYALPTSPFTLTNTLLQVTQFNPLQSGYGDAMGVGALDECQADLDKVFGKLDQSSVWITRIHGELSRKALGQDLNLGAAMPQEQVSNTLQTFKTKGTTPSCPVFPPCPDATGSTGSGSSTGGIWGGLGNGGEVNSNASSGCAMSGPAIASAPLGLLVAALGLGIARRRSRRRDG